MKFIDIRAKDGQLRFCVSKELATKMVSELEGTWVEKNFKRTGKTMVFVFDTHQIITTFASNIFGKEQGAIAGYIFSGDYVNLNQKD